MSALVFVAALLIGSFLNVVIYRVPRKESLFWPGSHCATCGQVLKVWDLIPVVSYLWLRGRCRSCEERISIRYPLVEVLTAITFYLVYLRWGLSVWTAAGWAFTAILIVAAFTDIDEGIIPDLITYPGILLGITFSIFTIGIKTSLIGMLVFGAAFFLIAILSHGGMGGGDIKLAAAIGAFAGLQGALLVFIISSQAGGLWALGLLAMKRADRNTAVVFGPFLSLGAYIVFLYGSQLLDLYLGMF